MMKQMLLSVMVLVLLGCNSETTTEGVVTAVNGVNGSSCSVAPEFSTGESSQQIGARISCTDGSFSIVMNGARGEVGLSGAIGPVGQSCVASRQSHDDRVKIQCGNQAAVYIYDGRDGQSCSVSQQSNGARITCGNSVAFVYNGERGSVGATGQAGSSCTVSNTSTGARITCGNTSQDLYDGKDSALANAIGIASYIYPCGKDEFSNDEIFLRLTDGKILALYDGGANLDRLVLLAPGQYVTTDRTGNKECNITVDNNLNVTSSIGSQGNGH